MQQRANDTTVARGREAEQRALAYLQHQGLRLVSQNFRVKGGEIDVVMREGTTVVFVEVRQRRTLDYGGAAASITATKRRRLILAARHYLARFGESPCRFDCLLIQGETVSWLRGAFTTDG